jgi:hypothetical protein
MTAIPGVVVRVINVSAAFSAILLPLYDGLGTGLLLNRPARRGRRNIPSGRCQVQPRRFCLNRSPELKLSGNIRARRWCQLRSLLALDKRF